MKQEKNNNNNNTKSPKIVEYTMNLHYATTNITEFV